MATWLEARSLAHGDASGGGHVANDGQEAGVHTPTGYMHPGRQSQSERRRTSVHGAALPLTSREVLLYATCDVVVVAIEGVLICGRLVHGRGCGGRFLGRCRVF
jgi:hypothetical protein